MKITLDSDQKNILYVYSLYSNELRHQYLQYTAACALIFHLNHNGVFNYNPDELLVYDYKEERRYIWEAKKFMNDINLLRDHDLLIRARSRSNTSRDVNAHQCSVKGQEFINQLAEIDNESFAKIRELLLCRGKTLKSIELTDQGPVLKCAHQTEPIDGFLKSFKPGSTQLISTPEYSPYFL